MATVITFRAVRPRSRPSEIRSLGSRESASQIAIQNGHAREFAISESSGAFSVKWIPRGAALYRVDRANHRLAGNNVLLLNAGQPYEVEFLERTGTESFCLFFSDSLVRDAWASFLAGTGVVDVQDDATPAMPPEFPDLVFRPEPVIADFLVHLRYQFAVCKMPLKELEEQLLLFLERLIAISQDHRRLALRVPVEKPATRRAVLIRLQRVRDLIEDASDTMPTLDQLAAASCLSKFHMLRLFKATFGVPPLRYAEACKIKRAMPLLRDRRLTVSEVAAAVGYESQSAFTRSFRRHAGVTPATFRNAQ